MPWGIRRAKRRSRARGHQSWAQGFPTPLLLSMMGLTAHPAHDVTFSVLRHSVWPNVSAVPLNRTSTKDFVCRVFGTWEEP